MAVELARGIFEIISADSIQVYKYLDIGSSKPGAGLRKKVRHHLIDIIEPDSQFTAGDFCRSAVAASDEISAAGRIPFFVGGTGLYINSFFMGLAEIPSINREIRENLLLEIVNKGVEALYNELLLVDSIFAGRIHPNDRQRILRGLEVFRQTGRPISSYHELNSGHESDRTLYLGLHDDRDIIRERIDTRVDGMIKKGFIDEVISLRNMGYGPDLNSMKSIGYFEINEYIDGKKTIAEAVDRIKIETRKYAKRQMTWFRKNSKINWFKPSEYDKIFNFVEKWLNRFHG